MKDAKDDVESYPNNKKPACPIEAVEHEHAAKDRENPGDVNDPMSFEFGNALSGGCINGWQQATKAMLPNAMNSQLMTVIERGRLFMGSASQALQRAITT